MGIYSRSYFLEAQSQPFLDSSQDNGGSTIIDPILSDNGNKFQGDGTDITMEEKKFGDSKAKRSSFAEATLNGMNVLAGLGVFSTPYAVSEGGWLSLILLVLFAVVCCYTGFLLCRCLDANPQLMSYQDVGEAAFGRYGRLLVSIFLYSELFVVAVELLILEGDNLAQIFPLSHVNILNVSLKPESIFVLLSAMVMLPTVWLRDLQHLAYVSTGGVFALVLVILAVAYIGITDVGFHYQGNFLNLHSFPFSIGIYAYCFCGHSIFPSIYVSMNHKRQFSNVLIICFVLCTLIYGGIGIMGYLMFGDDVQSQVTLSLPREVFASKVAIVTTILGPFTKYALMLAPLNYSLEKLLSSSQTKEANIFGNIYIRTLLVISTVVVALFIPFFAYLMAFAGSFMSNIVAMIIPCLCYLKIFKGKLNLGDIILCVLVTFVGLIASAIGTYNSICEILNNV